MRSWLKAENKPCYNQSLKDAVQRRCGVTAVQKLLDAGANPNCSDYTPAHKCGRGWDAGELHARRVRTVTLLPVPYTCAFLLTVSSLRTDYFPSSTTHVLAMAVRAKDVEVVRALLKAGADPSRGEWTGSSSFQQDGGMRSDTSEHSSSPMDIALRMGLKDIARELYQLNDKAAALSESTNLPDCLANEIIEGQIANLQPAPAPVTRTYNQFR